MKEFTFRPALRQEIKSYASHTPALTADTMDCSLGTNPYGCPSEAQTAFRAFDISLLSSYPHDRVLHRALADYWENDAAFDADELTLCNGSICGIYYLCNMFSQAERREVVGFIPTFTDAVESFRIFGMAFRGVPIRLSENGKACADDLIASLSDQTALVYIDRPNNPTGQTLSLSELESILSAAEANGSYVLVDEAYGDFIPKEESALCLRAKHPHLVVLRTFSKGFGLANLRCGYIVANGEVSGCLSRSLNPYIPSDLNRQICAAALSAPNHVTAHADDFVRAKEKLREVTGKCLKLLCTDDRVPICTWELQEPGDLQELLLAQNVLAVSGREFELLDERYVRIRIPAEEEFPRLLHAITALEQA